MQRVSPRQAVWLAVATATFLLSLVAAPARAEPPSQVIQSAGALTAVRIGNELSCQVTHAGYRTNEFFPPGFALGDCGTFLSVGGALFGPDFGSQPESSFPVNETIYTPFTAVSQSAVTGAGTPASPFVLVTTVTAGATGLSITETDSYVTGAEAYRTDIVVANAGEAPVTALLYRGADCYMQGSDNGFGVVTAAGAPACAARPNNSPSGQVQELSPQTPGSRYMQGEFTEVWEAVNAQTDLPNTCDCTINQDNGVAINWNIAVPAGGSVAYAMFSNFSAAGQVVGAPATVTGPPTATSSTRATLTGTVNPGGREVTDCHFDYGATSTYGSSAPCAEAVGAGAAPVAVSANVPDLKPGRTYHYRLSATTAGGTTTGADQNLLTAKGPDAPTLGKSANVVPVSGKVFVKLPKGRTSAAVSAVRSLLGLTKGKGFAPISETRQLPMGSQIDARRGTLQLVVATARPAVTQSARLGGGAFKVTQVRRGRRKGLTTFALKKGVLPGSPSYKRCPSRVRPGKRTDARSAQVSRKALQTLRAKGKKGKFRTRGRFSAGTVRGTSWTTTDRCDGTLTKVKRGIVDVRNFGQRKTVAVRAGYSYLSKVRGPSRPKRFRKRR